MAFNKIRLNAEAEKIAKTIYEDDEDLMTALPEHCRIPTPKPNRELMLIAIDEYAKLDPKLTPDQVEICKQEIKDNYPR